MSILFPEFLCVWYCFSIVLISERLLVGIQNPSFKKIFFPWVSLKCCLFVFLLCMLHLISPIYFPFFGKWLGLFVSLHALRIFLGWDRYISICLEIDCSGSIFPGKSYILSVCRFRCFLPYKLFLIIVFMLVFFIVLFSSSETPIIHLLDHLCLYSFFSFLMTFVFFLILQAIPVNCRQLEIHRSLN